MHSPALGSQPRLAPTGHTREQSKTGMTQYAMVTLTQHTRLDLANRTRQDRSIKHRPAA